MLNIITIRPSDSYAFRPTDSVVSHGMALFETLRIAEGQLLFWRRHWDRLLESAHFFNLGEELASSEDSVLTAIRSFYQEELGGSAILKLSLFRSNSGLNLMIYTRDAMEFTGAKTLCLNVDYPINEKSLITGHKTHNYFENMWLLQAARKQGYYDYLRLNSANTIAETCVSNVFIKLKDRFVTPSLRSGVLPGVIRSVMLELDILSESIVEVNDLRKMDAIYLGNSVQGIVPVNKVFDTQNEIVFEMIDAFNDSVCPLRKHLKAFEQKESHSLN